MFATLFFLTYLTGMIIPFLYRDVEGFTTLDIVVWPSTAVMLLIEAAMEDDL